MIQIRKHPDVEAALYISGLDVKLPADHSWVTISSRFSVDEIEGSKNLEDALKVGFIEMRIDGDYSDAPSWFLESYADAVRIPVEVLDDNELTAVQKLESLKASAHPIMWAIIRSELFNVESEGRNRPNVLNMLR